METLFHFNLDRKHFEDERVKGFKSRRDWGVLMAYLKPLTAEVQNVILKMMEMLFRFLQSLVTIFKNSICHFSVEPVHLIINPLLEKNRSFHFFGEKL